MTTATAPGKLILCGEHAVVYGVPAIAVPVSGVQAQVTVETTSTPGVVFDAPDLGAQWTLASQPTHPFSYLLRSTLRVLGYSDQPAFHITLASTIPVASGMGSGAALGAALVRAVAQHLGYQLLPSKVSSLVYESERFYHGTPSGIDNTVVSFGWPLVFQRTHTGPHLEPLTLGAPMTLVVGDTGVRCPTHETVGGVRTRHAADPAHYEGLFTAIGTLVATIRTALASGDLPAVGPLLDQNQTLLEAVGVSSPELERLIVAARAAGATGAKLSGGGGGGVMLALVTPATAWAVAAALTAAGATNVLTTVVQPTSP